MTACIPPKEQAAPDVWQVLYEQHKAFKEVQLKDRRFTPALLENLLKELAQDERFSVEQAGKSVEGRPIYLVKLGSGPKKVLLWSQMHGDEPTATAALADLFNFFQQEGDAFDSLRQQILQNTTLYFVPMLNPDGAERYQRRNALDIDLNRDAQRLVSPESQLLKQLRDSLQADWGFNLHDQNIRYAAGPKGPPASISLLAPPIDEEGTVDATRAKAMQLVVRLNEVLQSFIPNGVGKWKDEFEPRAFGENMQRWGSSTVLIESGGYQNDPERQQVRRLNFVAILAGLHSIATGSWQQENIADYDKLPENARYLFDLVIRNAQLEKGDYTYTADIAIDRNEKELRQPGEPLFYYESSIEDIGDLSVFRGYQEFDAKGMQLQPGRVYPFAFTDVQQLQLYGVDKLLQEGYTSVMVKELPEEAKFSKLRINLQTAKTAAAFGLDEPADFVLLEDGKVCYVIVNGFIHDVQKGGAEIKNARLKR